MGKYTTESTLRLPTYTVQYLADVTGDLVNGTQQPTAHCSMPIKDLQAPAAIRSRRVYRTVE